MKRILKACVEGFILVLLMYLFLVVFETQINFSKYGIDVMGVWTNAYFPLFILISGFSYIHSFSLVNIDHEFVRVQKEEVYNRLSDSEKKLADSMDFIEREAFLYKRIQEVLENEGEDAFKNIKENFEKDSKEWNHKLKITRLFCDLFIAVGLVFVLSSPVQAIVNFYEAFEERRIYLQETVVDQTLYLEGYPPIVLMGDGQFTNGDVEYIVNEILPSQPKGLIVLPSSIVFMKVL